MKAIRWSVGLVLAALGQGVLARAADEGRLLASGCFQCHGTNGRGGIDELAGESAAETLKKLSEIRLQAARKDIMIPHARGYTPYQLQKIAEYFARQPKP